MNTLIKKIVPLVLLLIIVSCQDKKELLLFKTYKESVLLEKQGMHQKPRMRFKLFQSKVLDMNTIFKPFKEELASNFSEKEYKDLKPLIIEQDIPSIQNSIKEGRLSYEKLTLFYLYRIREFESDSTKSLHAIISLNPSVLEEARARDINRDENDFLIGMSVYGMPILLKDNINTEGMPTTAGAIALYENKNTDDAFIVKRLKASGALILGKTNLSEWAYYFCGGCPVGYSAVGGQTLNPYGRATFESGGSSSGSGATVAANYAVASIGTETSGSITSPSSQNSIVGLKPTIGMLSRSGIVPISTTLDTPGPMTKNIIDNYIVLTAMSGYDASDSKSFEFEDQDFGDIEDTFKGRRFGVFKDYLQDSIYRFNINKIKEAGAEIIEISPNLTDLPGFLSVLNIEMKHDLPNYLSNYADKNVKVISIEDVINFNNVDTVVRAPYGQLRFKNIGKDTVTLVQLETIKKTLMTNARNYFQALDLMSLDAILSINNSHAGYSAVAEYPNLTVPMGYKSTGEPVNLTFIGKPKEEGKLLLLGYIFEQLTKHRKLPKNYQ
ncbi:MAG: amidase family protein [Flavobacteriaceae bacterium]|jgi:amidase|tara:strand:+ start:7410 stop:9068 length:1659 start_codon:yes stop_codon:yes gene_type:complete